ncbi:MAG TPA: O-antigen ligase family protein [Povalibacter sp.]
MAALRNLALSAWLLYPLMLFLLPNELAVGPFAPETLFALLGGAIAASVMLFALPVATLGRTLQGMPMAVVVFAVSVIVLMLFKGGFVAVLRACSWVIVLVFSFVVFRDERMFERLLKIWFWVAVGASLALLLKYGAPLPGKIAFLSWQHRTVFGYFDAVALAAGIVLLRSGRIGSRAYYLAGLIVVVLGLLATLARGPWLLALIAVMVLDGPTRRAAVIAACLFAAAAVVVMPESLLEDLSSRWRSLYDWEVGSSSLYRFNLYRAALASMPETWIAGAPTMDIGPFLAQYAPVRYPAFYKPGFNADSDVIYLLLLGGVPLIAVMCWVIASLAGNISAVAAVSPATHLVAMKRVLLVSAVMQMLLDSIIWTAFAWFLIGTAIAVRDTSRGET